MSHTHHLNLQTLVEFPRHAHVVGTQSLSPYYTITLLEQLFQIPNDPRPLGNIFQGLVKYIVTRYGNAALGGFTSENRRTTCDKKHGPIYSL